MSSNIIGIEDHMDKISLSYLFFFFNNKKRSVYLELDLIGEKSKLC